MVGSRRTVDSWTSLQSLPKIGSRHQVNRRWSHNRPTGWLWSLSRQEIITQSTDSVVVTKSTRGRHTVDRWGCRHQVSKRGEVINKLTRGRHTVDRRSGDTKSPHAAGTPSQPKQRGHQVNPGRGDTKSTQGAGTPSQPTERGRQVNPRSGDTKSTQERKGTPSQPTKKGRHQVNPRRKGGDTKSTHRKIAGSINWWIERGRSGGNRRAHNLLKAEQKRWRSSIVCRSKEKGKLRTYIWKREKENWMPTAKAGAQCRVPVPRSQHGGRQGRWGQARPMGAASHRPPATCPSPPALTTREATRSNH